MIINREQAIYALLDMAKCKTERDAQAIATSYLRWIDTRSEHEITVQLECEAFDTLNSLGRMGR